MSDKITLKETKNDGWRQITTYTSMGGPGINNISAWDQIFISLLNDGESYKKLNTRNKKEIKKEIQKHLNQYINDVKNDLMQDLNHFITIEPYKKPPLTPLQKLQKQIRDQGYKNIIGLQALVTPEEHDYFLNVLPPIYTKKGFMVSEPLTHTHKGPVFYHFYKDKQGYKCEIVQSSEYVSNKELIKMGLI